VIEEETREKIKNQTRTYMVGAFGLVAGLAWNDAIKSLIETLFPFSSSGIWAKFIYAVLITIIVVLLGQYIFKAPTDKK